MQCPINSTEVHAEKKKYCITSTFKYKVSHQLNFQSHIELLSVPTRIELRAMYAELQLSFKSKSVKLCQKFLTWTGVWTGTDLVLHAI